MPQAEDGRPNESSQQPFDWKAFSHKTWVVVVRGLLLPPVGIILAWLKPDWTTRGKWIATALLGLLLMGRLGGDKSSDPVSSGQSDRATDTSSRQQPARSAGSGGTMTKKEFEKEYREMCRDARETFNRKLFEEAWQVMRQTGQGY
jgi:hypothetical protein